MGSRSVYARIKLEAAGTQKTPEGTSGYVVYACSLQHEGRIEFENGELEVEVVSNKSNSLNASKRF